MLLGQTTAKFRGLQCGLVCAVRLAVFACVSLSLLSGCTSLPASGPSSKAILAGQASSKPDSLYNIVDITPAAVVAANYQAEGESKGHFASLPKAHHGAIGIGDNVAITIFEATSGGLFTSASGSNALHVVLPAQAVDRSGLISVPYAGSIRAAGRSPIQVQKTIENRLANRAIDPQAMVTVISNASNLVTVTGDVAQSARVPLSGNGERMLDAVAMAGGPKSPAFETFVKITRSGKSSEMLLQHLVDSPKDNIVLEAGDQIFVERRPQSFTVLGASVSNDILDFKSANVSLAEAMAQAGGLDDRRADPSGVFLFRFEASSILQELGVARDPGNTTEPVVYRLDLRDPASLLLAQRFPVRNRDVLYLANSPSTELGKFLQLIGAGVGIAANSTTVSSRF